MRNKNIPCTCGRNKHEIRAKYCGDCGKQLRKDSAPDPSYMIYPPPPLTVSEKMNSLIIKDQIQLLVDWNKETIKTNPEQVRKNVETIIYAIQCSG